MAHRKNPPRLTAAKKGSEETIMIVSKIVESIHLSQGSNVIGLMWATRFELAQALSYTALNRTRLTTPARPQVIKKNKPLV